MRDQRPRHRSMVFGPLTVALLLHGFGLSLAACFGLRAPVQVEEAFDTFALSWRPASVEGGEDAEGTEVEAGALEEVEQLEEETAPPEMLALEPLPETLLPETAFFLSEAPVVLDPLPVDPITPDPSEQVADAPEPAAPFSAPQPVTSSEAGTPGIGVGTRAEGLPLALLPRRATTWTSVLGDAREEHELAPVGPRPGKTQAAVAAAPRTLVVREPKPVETPRPSYPGLSRRVGEEGSVLCRLHIDAAGAVTEVEVVESSGSERLDQCARTTLLSWRFEPRQDGRSVASTLLHRVTFRLES